MAPKGYSTHQRVADYLGITLTAAQQTQATYLIERAEDFIDDHCDAAWGDGAVSNEEHRPLGEYIWLKKRPLGTLTSISYRTYLGGAYTALVSGTDYELDKSDFAKVYLPGWASYERIRVTYTPGTVVATLPAKVELAATIMAAYWLRPNLTGFDISGISSYKIGDELEVTQSTGQNLGGTGRQLALPAEAIDLLQTHRRNVVPV